MLRALTEAGIEPDLIGGSSAGAWNAVAFATDPTVGGLDQLEGMWLRLRRCPPTSSRRTCTRGAPWVLSDGDTVTALLASSAFPGLFPPVQLGRQQLVDGGVSADIPVQQAETLGASTTYVLPAAASDDWGGRPRGPLALAYHALGQILDAAVVRDTADATGTVHVLPAPRSWVSNPLDFSETARLIQDGYRLAATWLCGAHRRGMLAVAHVATCADVVTAVNAGVDVLGHVPTNNPLRDQVVDQIAALSIAVIPPWG